MSLSGNYQHLYRGKNIRIGSLFCCPQENKYLQYQDKQRKILQ